MEPSAVVAPLSTDSTYLISALVIVTLLLAALSLYLVFKMRRLNLIFEKMMQGSSGESIEKMMLERIHDIEVLKKNVADLRTGCEKLEIENQKHIQQVGVVRFNAFDNTGSDLSFAVALLDASNSGFVLSGIYGREESRVYAKPVLKGESTYLLTKEEKQALDVAGKNNLSGQQEICSQ